MNRKPVDLATVMNLVIFGLLGIVGVAQVMVGELVVGGLAFLLASVTMRIAVLEDRLKRPGAEKGWQP